MRRIPSAKSGREASLIKAMGSVRMMTVFPKSQYAVGVAHAPGSPVYSRPASGNCRWEQADGLLKNKQEHPHD
jgi:hypothetical protein